MYEGYDQEWSLPYTDNYTGPYWSDGKFQKSVVSGRKKPMTLLDSYSEEHDKWSALCKSDACLNAADDLYELQTSNMSFFPRMIGKIPKTFNKPARELMRWVGGENKSKMNVWEVPDVVSEKVNFRPKNSVHNELYKVDNLAPTAVYTPQGETVPIENQQKFAQSFDNVVVQPQDTSQQWLGGNSRGLTRRDFALSRKRKKKKN